MVVNAESLGTQITIGEDKRITSIGKFLRKYKLDELPQLFNVFLGQMSLVGPRPEVPKYVDMYTNEQLEVLTVRPGITDYASLKYSDENDLLGKVSDPENYYINVIMQDKLKLNLAYIKNNNVFKDIKIIFQTILKCL
jgi:lipopolysaccharide/colanic/teichoic acid biosynthesis glycosyltransferase